MQTYNNDISQKSSDLTNFLGYGPGVHAVDAWDVVVLEPLSKTFVSGPVRVFPRIGAYHETSNVNFTALEVCREAVLVPNRFVGYAVVSDERVGKHENLAAVGRIRQGFGIPDHARVEHHLARNRRRSTEASSHDWCRSIGED